MNCLNKVWKGIHLVCLMCNITNTEPKINLQQLSANIKLFWVQIMIIEN